MKAWGSVIESPLGAIPSPACSGPTTWTPTCFNNGDRPAPVELSEPGNQAASSQPSADDRQIGIKHQPRLHPIFLGGNPGEQPTEQRQQQRHAEEHEISHPSLCRRIDWAVSNSKGWEQLPQSEDDIN